MCLPLSSCAKLAYVPFGQNKSDRHMFHIEIFAFRIIIHEDMFAGKMSNLVDVCDHSHCVLDTRKSDIRRCDDQERI